MTIWTKSEISFKVELKVERIKVKDQKWNKLFWILLLTPHWNKNFLDGKMQ